MTTKLQRIVLVVKDTLTSTRLAQTMSQEGVQVVTCEEPEAAEALLSQGPIDILVVDLPLGLPLVHHVTSNYPDTILVGMAQNCSTSMAEEAERAGVQIILEQLDFEPHPENHHSNLVQHFERLEDFLAKNQVAALLQPIVSLQNPKQILGFESLARPPRHLPLWNPETLFAYAARKEHLLETDLFCLRAAFKEASLLPGLQKLFVNLRPRSVTHPLFTKKIIELSGDSGFKPSQLVFELTEQQSILNLKTFLENLDHLRGLGYQIALDDFGTGFANLQWLYDLKPDYLKIAGVFCRNLEHDPTKQVLLTATTEIAHKLGITTVLENIETQSEFEAARKLGIDYGQGYYFMKPGPVSELLKLLPEAG